MGGKNDYCFILFDPYAPKDRPETPGPVPPPLPLLHLPHATLCLGHVQGQCIFFGKKYTEIQQELINSLPIGSMYGIYASIWDILMVNVTIYSIHGSYGLWPER